MESSYLDWVPESLIEIMACGVLWVSVYSLVYTMLTKLAKCLFLLVNIQEVFSSLVLFPTK